MSNISQKPEMVLDNVNPLFNYFVAVKLKPNENGEVESYIDWRFPSGELPKGDNHLMSMISDFCFPDKDKFPVLKISNKNKKFTFVVTSVDGVKRFGYCKRQCTGEISLSNKGRRYAICYCILSHSPCHSLFDYILEIIDGLSKDSIMVLLQKLQRMKVPDPGEKIEFSILNYDQIEKQFRFTRPKSDLSLSGFASFDVILTMLDPFTIASILVSMLLERRIIFVCSKLSTLSSCVQACIALLNPLVWQHVYIPVLPLKMISFVCAPVPFVVGLLSIHLDKLYEQSDGMEEVILVDIDKSTITSPTKDIQLLPDSYILGLIGCIYKAKMLAEETAKKKEFNLRSILINKGRKNIQNEDEITDILNNTLEKGIASFLSKILGHYNTYIKNGEFDKEGFINHKGNIKEFLTLMTGSQLFEQFIAHQTTDEYPLKDEIGEKFNETIYFREGYLGKFGKGFRGNLSGFVAKSQNNEVGSFHQRYFKLSSFSLKYYKNRSESEPSGEIILNQIKNIKLLEFQGFSDCIEIKTSNRTYYMYSSDTSNIKYWLDVIKWRWNISLDSTTNNSTSPPVVKATRPRSRHTLPPTLPIIYPKNEMKYKKKPIEFIPFRNRLGFGNSTDEDITLSNNDPPNNVKSERVVKMRKHSGLSKNSYSSIPRPNFLIEQETNSSTNSSNITNVQGPNETTLTDVLSKIENNRNFEMIMPRSLPKAPAKKINRSIPKMPK